MYYRSNLAGLKDHYNTVGLNEDTRASLSSVRRRHVLPKIMDRELFPLKDASLHGILSHEVTGLVTFLESNFLMNIHKIVVKFAISPEGKPIFIGASKCQFSFKNQGTRL